MSVSTTSVLHDVTTVPSNLTSTMNISDDERDRYLSHLDDVIFLQRVPAVVFLFILMVVGIFGNILVLLVHLKKFKQSPIRVFVVSLAIFDLLTCVASMPGEMLDMRYMHTFNYPNLCRLLRFNNTFTVVSSGAMLIVVAIDRYRKICRPLQKQITIPLARLMVGVTVTFAFVLAIPAAVLAGRKTVITDQEGIVGFNCSFDDRWRDTLFQRIYTTVLFLLFVGSLIVLTVLYTLIGKTAFSRRKLTYKRSLRSVPHMSTSETKLSSGDAWISPRKTSPTSAVSAATAVKGEALDSSQLQKPEVSDISNSETVISTWRSEPSSKGVTLTKFAKHKSRSSALKVHRRRNSGMFSTTLMLFIITAVFIVSLLPYLILMLLRSFKSNFVESLQGGGIIVYNIFLRSYFINSAANCIVYSFCNFKFRIECKKIFASCLKNVKK